MNKIDYLVVITLKSKVFQRKISKILKNVNSINNNNDNFHFNYQYCVLHDGSQADILITDNVLETQRGKRATIFVVPLAEIEKFPEISIDPNTYITFGKNTNQIKFFISQIVSIDCNMSINMKIEERTKNYQLIKNDVFKAILNIQLFGVMLEKVSTKEVIYMNDSGLSFMGKGIEEVINKKISHLELWKNKEQWQVLRGETLKHIAVRNLEIDLIQFDGSERTVLMSTELIDYDGEEAIVYIGIDITNIKKIRDEKESILKKEHEIINMKSQFIAMITHEFRTPLTSIMLASDLLKRYGSSMKEDALANQYDKIQKTILHMTKLMENVIIISKMDDDNFALHPSNVNLVEFVGKIVESIKYSFSSNHQIYIDCNEACSSVVIDETLAGLIFTNVITNAIKYSPKAEKVEIELKCSDKTLSIKVKDFGIGMKEEEVSKIYNSFFRGSNVTNIPGYGLGMTIVKKCIDKYQGKIKIQTEYGHGMEVKIEIPNNIKF